MLVRLAKGGVPVGMEFFMGEEAKSVETPGGREEYRA